MPASAASGRNLINQLTYWRLNMSIFDASNFNLTTFTDFSSAPERETWSGLPKRVEPTDHRLAFESSGSVNGLPLITPERAARERAREAGLLHDPVEHVRKTAPTKPTVNTLSNHRRNLHESSHGIASYLLNRPIVRISVLEKNGNAGHVLHYNPAAPNKDDLILLAAGRAGEEVLLHSVFEHGCSGDDERARELALKLSGGDTDAANTLLREAAIAARALVEKHSSAIHKFSMRLAIKKELVLDEAETAIRECIEAFEKKPVELDDEWKAKIARAQSEISVRKWKEEQAAKAAPGKSVLRQYDLSKREDVEAFSKRFPAIKRTEAGELIHPAGEKVRR
jgi:hypothetical protein